MGHITIVLFCSESKSLIRMKDGTSRVCAALSIRVSIHCFQMGKEKQIHFVSH